MLIIIIVVGVLIYQWTKKEKAIRAAEDEKPKPESAVKVAKWLDGELKKEDPNWRERVEEEDRVRERKREEAVARGRITN
jgi:hypothetical protein